MPLTRFLAHQANHRSSDRCLDVAPTSSGIRSRPVLASGLMDTQRAPSEDTPPRDGTELSPGCNRAPISTLLDQPTKPIRRVLPMFTLCALLRHCLCGHIDDRACMPLQEAPQYFR